MPDILKLSDASSLAFHAMALLARYPETRFSTTKMAELFDASEHTLAKAMHSLVRAGFVDAVRGAGGGFSLTKSPHDITLLDIYQAVDGTLEEQRCLLGKPACNGEKCVMQGLMGKLYKELHGYFSRMRLDALARNVAIGDVEIGKGLPEKEA
jgi:Rrf2 family protein